jgi:hypothetical protein
MRLAVDLSISGIAVLRGSSSGVASLTAPGALVNDGDSITVGYGTLMGYPGRFTNLSGIATDNQAVAGETMATMNTNYSTVIAPIYNALSYNTLLMSAGTNDIGTASTGPGVTDAQLEVTVQSYASKARATGYKIWLTTIMPRNDTTVAWDATKEGYRVAYNSWLKANWASFADGLIDWTLIPETADPNSVTYFQDKLHPTDALQQIMGAYLQTRMGGVTRAAPIPITTPIIGTATFNTGNKEFTTTATTTTVRGTTALSGKTCFCGELEVYPGADAVGVGVGIITASGAMGFDGNNSICYYANNVLALNSVNVNASVPAYRVPPGNLASIIVDVPNSKLWVTLDGVNFYGSGAAVTKTQLEAGTGGFDISPVTALGSIYPQAGNVAVSGSVWRFVSYPYAVPAGYTAASSASSGTPIGLLLALTNP